MRWLITLLLLVLVAGGGAVLFFGDQVLPPLGFRAPAPPPSPVAADLALLDPAAVRRIEIVYPDRTSRVFERGADGWRQPDGLFDLRQPEVNELLAALAGLRTRYQAVPVTGDGADLGLAVAQSPLRITVVGRERSRILTFGRSASTPESAFGRPAYVRVDDGTEALRVAPEVYAIVSRPPDTYQRRQLFAEARRERFDDPTAGPRQAASDARKLFLDDRVTAVEVTGPDGRYTLTRFAPTPAARRDPAGRSGEPAVLPAELAAAWKLTAPTEDRIDPAKLKAILTTLPDLWIERNLDPEPLADVFTDYLRASAPTPFAAALLQATDRTAQREQVRARLTGFTRDWEERYLGPLADAVVGAAWATTPTVALPPVCRETVRVLVVRALAGWPTRFLSAVAWLAADPAGQGAAAVVPAALQLRDFPVGPARDPQPPRGLGLVERGFSVIRADGRRTTLRLGAVSRVEFAKKEGDRGQPERDLRREYRFAKLDGSPRVFEVRADVIELEKLPPEPGDDAKAERVREVSRSGLADVFLKADALADPKLARFATDEVAAVTITSGRTTAAAAVGSLAGLDQPPPVAPAAIGGLAALDAPGKASAACFAAVVKPLTAVTLTRVKGKPTAATEKGKKDRWFLGDRLAEATEVTELLNALTGLEAKAATDRQPTREPFALPLTVELEVEPKVADGDDPLPKRTHTFVLADRHPCETRLAVAVAGWPRLNWIDAPLPDPTATPARIADELAARPAATYRSRQLFDTADSTLDRVGVALNFDHAVAGTPAATGGLAKIAPPILPTGFEVTLSTQDGKWSLAAPVTATADAAAQKLAADLAGLTTVEEKDETPTAEKLREFGLSVPRLTVSLGFRGTDARTETLVIGGDVPSDQKLPAAEPQVYARRGAGGVFTVRKSVAKTLAGGAESLLPKQPWTTTAEKVVKLDVKRGDAADDSYRLVRYDAGPKKWAVEGRFTALAESEQAEELARIAAALAVVRYEPLGVSPARRAEYGLDRPAARLAVTVRDENNKETTHAVRIGNPTEPGGAERFARLDEPNAPVFVLPEAVYAAVDKSALAYLDRKFLTLEAGNLTRLQLAGPTADASLALATDGSGWKPEGVAFPLDEPTVSTLVTAATRLTVMRVVGHDLTGFGYRSDVPPVTAASGAWAGLIDFGFDKPARALTLTLQPAANAPPETVVIQLGKEEPTGERYVRVAGRPSVGIISGFVTAALTKGRLDVIDRALFDFDPQKTSVVGITRTKGGEVMELAPMGRGWEVAKPKKFKADAPLIEALAAELGSLRAARVAAFAPADLKTPFGLEPPIATVAIKVDGKDRTLQIGNPAPDEKGKPTEDRFARVVGSPVIAVIPAALADRLLADPVKFSDRTLNPNRIVDADKVVVSRDGRTATFARKDGVWRMSTPAEATAESGELDELIGIASQLRADELVANDVPAGKLKELGFDPPVGRIVISDGDKEVLNLLIGNKEKNGSRVHAKLEKGGLVGLLDPLVSAKVTAEFRTRAAWPAVDPAQVETVAFSGEGGNFALRRKDELMWEDTADPKAPIKSAVVFDTVAALTGLKAERYVADKDAKLGEFGLDKPKRVLVLTLRGGEKKVLHLGKAVGKQVYAKVEDAGRTDVFVLSEADSARLTKDRKAFGP